MSEISFYKQSQDYRVLNKALEAPLVKQVNIRSDIDIYNPVLYLQDFDIAYNYFVWNNRYYFIQSAYYTAKEIWQLQCHIDVLMTYKESILASKATLTSSTMLNNYMQGTNIPTTSKPTFVQYTFPNTPFGYNSDTHILIGIGGNTSGTA